MRRTVPLVVMMLTVAASLLTSDQSASAVTCRDAMIVEYLEQTAWWTTGNRPPECTGVGDAEFARLADEVTGVSR